MAVSIDEVIKRWTNIRDNDDCNLSLEPEFVSKFVHKKESELVQEKITETLRNLANLRIEKEHFASDEPAAQGDM